MSLHFVKPKLGILGYVLFLKSDTIKDREYELLKWVSMRLKYL